MKNLLLGLLVLWVAQGTLAHDDDGIEVHCDIEYNYGVESGPELLRVHDANQTLYSFDPEWGLRSAGDSIALDDSQQQLLTRYQGEIHASNREMVAIAVEAVEIAILGVELAFAIITGEDGPEQELSDALLEVRQRALEAYEQKGNIYHVGPGGLDELGDIIDPELEEKLGSAALRSTRSIGWSLIKAMFTGGKNIERRAETMTAEVEDMLETRGEAIEARAEALCTRMKSLPALEAELHEAIPALTAWPLITVR